MKRVFYGLCLLVLISLGPLFFLEGCSENSPVTIGLIAGLSGSNADLGQAGRNGALLAVEEYNQRVAQHKGQSVSLIIRDDANEKATARGVADELCTLGVKAIIGPYTTAMTEAVLEVAKPRDMLVLSPTASATSLSGTDDVFFRINASTSQNGQAYARFVIEDQGLKRVSLVIDKKNATFAHDWIRAFLAQAKELGVETVQQVWYASGAITDFADLQAEIMRVQPEVVLFVANAVDVARIAQQLRKTMTTLRFFAAEWAGTQQLIELGGKAVEGLVVLHLYDMFGTQKAYEHFVVTYTQRFNSVPSFSSILSYETVQIVLTALEQQQTGESLKETILSGGPYQGLQQPLEFNAFGDSHRKAYFVKIKNAHFVPAKAP